VQTHVAVPSVQGRLLIRAAVEASGLRFSYVFDYLYREADAARISYTSTRKVPGIAFGRPVWPGARGSKSGTAR
jgi:hypothetical protein